MIQRVKQLTDAGVIQITAVSDPLQLGFARQAMLGITVERNLTKQVAKALADIPEVVYVVITAGGFDILVEVVGESDAHLLELVTAASGRSPGWCRSTPSSTSSWRSRPTPGAFARRLRRSRRRSRRRRTTCG